jgi:hypothetical protein
MKKTDVQSINNRGSLTILVISFLHLLSCGSPEKPALPSIRLDNQTELLISLVSEIATEIKYIPLGVTGEMPVGSIRMIRVTHDKILVLSGQIIFCFDKEGSYLFRLDKRGRGPGEYSSIGTFDVESNGEVLVVSSFGKLLYYRLADNGFVFYKELERKSGPGYHLTGLNFVPGTSNLLMSFATEGIEEFRNVLIDINGDTLLLRRNQYRYRPSASMGFVSPEEILQFSDGHLLYFKELFNDTVYSVTEESSFVPIFVLKAGKEGITPDHISNLTRESAALLNEKLHIDRIFKSNNLFFILVTFRELSYYEIIDIEKGSRRRFSNGLVLQDDIMGNIEFQPKYSDKGSLYSWIEPGRLKESVAPGSLYSSEYPSDSLRSFFNNLVMNLQEDDNPLLMVVTMK